jgi:hypothetical protein
MDMTIIGGQVVIHALRSTGNEPTLRGSVNTAGEVLASLQIGSYFFSMSGTIHDKAFTGQRLVNQCYWSVQMQIAPPPTMPFDGDYVGVSRESRSSKAMCAPRGDAETLIIRNSMVLGGWQGTVSPQGTLSLRSPRGTPVEAQIDGQGIIRGQDASRVGCSSIWVWRKETG